MKATKTFVLPSAIAAVVLLASVGANAQYKSPKQYFRKDSPGVNNGQNPSSPASPGKPAQPATPASPGTARPATPAKPSFKDVTVNATFFFLSDTNRSHPWTKVSATSAKNSTGVTRSFSGETLIQK